MSEREPQPLTAQPQADGARRECGSAAPSRSENAAALNAARAEASAALAWRGNTDTALIRLDPWTFAKVRRVEEALRVLLATTAAPPLDTACLPRVGSPANEGTSHRDPRAAS